MSKRLRVHLPAPRRRYPYRTTEDVLKLRRTKSKLSLLHQINLSWLYPHLQFDIFQSIQRAQLNQLTWDTSISSSKKWSISPLTSKNSSQPTSATPSPTVSTTPPSVTPSSPPQQS